MKRDRVKTVSGSIKMCGITRRHADRIDSPLANIIRPSEFSFLPFDPSELLSEVHQKHFPCIVLPDFCFIKKGTLASILLLEKPPLILLHSLLNHSDTPKEVMAYIFIHEQIHQVIPGRIVDGTYTSHPPEFRQLEAELVPDHARLWAWISAAFVGCGRPDFKKERIVIKSNWPLVWNSRWPSLKDIGRRAEFSPYSAGKVESESR